MKSMKIFQNKFLFLINIPMLAMKLLGYGLFKEYIYKLITSFNFKRKILIYLKKLGFLLSKII